MPHLIATAVNISFSRSLIVSLLVLLFLAAGGSVVAEQTAQIRIEFKDKKQFQEVRQLQLDVVESEGNTQVAFVSPEELSRLDQLGIEYTVIHSDVSAFYASRLDKNRTMGGYRTLSEIYLAMDSIAAAHPAIVSPRDSIGATIEGRPIYVMKISDNVSFDEDEEEIYYHSAIHCREVITPEVLIYFMRHLTNNYGIDPEATYIVNNRELYFTLVVNPDGYYYNELTEPSGGGLWRKNRRNNGDGTFGIDLNRNFGYEWGYDDEGSSPFSNSETYRGTGPFSEPETQGIRDFIESRNFTITLSYHSYSNIFIYPWGYEEIYTPEHSIFVAMGDSIQSFNGYNPGTAWELLYPVNGSTDDWGYGETTTKNKNYAVTIEVGGSSDGFWPPISRITPLVQENLEGNLFMARIADKLQQLAPPEAPVIVPVADPIEVDSFTLTWTHSDTLNPAVSFEVWQLSGFAATSDNAETQANPRWNFDGFEVSTQYASSGTHSYHSDSGDDLDNRLTTIYPYTVQAGDSLFFKARWDIENNWDYAYVQVSTDQGLNWTSIPGNITTTSNPNGTNLGNGITGSQTFFTQAKFSLGSYVGQSILLRFRYVTDGFVANPGFWVDDITPIAGFANVGLLSSSVVGTEYLVEDLESGIYSYRVRAKDAENQQSVFSNLEEVEIDLPPACSWLVGDANGDLTYSIADAVHIINFIFGGGAAPVPSAIGSGDADCSGSVSVGDAVLLINYIFGSGSAPGSGCSCTDFL